jgi:hypothetical protein
VGAFEDVIAVATVDRSSESAAPVRNDIKVYSVIAVLGVNNQIGIIGRTETVSNLDATDREKLGAQRP